MTLKGFWRPPLDLWLMVQETISDLVILQCNEILTRLIKDIWFYITRKTSDDVSKPFL